MAVFPTAPTSRPVCHQLWRHWGHDRDWWHRRIRGDQCSQLPPITFRGGSNFYGQAIGKTIDDQGGTNFYWDTSLVSPPANTNSFYAISMRELSY